MSAAVFNEVALSGERFRANGAPERLDATVQLQVRLPVLFASEPFWAHGARVRPVSRVRSHVDVQVAAQRELLSATRFRAGEAATLRVDADVALQVAQTGKRLVAPVATERPGRFQLVFAHRRRRCGLRVRVVRHVGILRSVALFANFIRNGVGRFLSVGQRDFRSVRR